MRILFFVFLFLTPVFSHAEEIQSFEANIDLSRDGTFTVTESIEYEFDDERHGIFRFIPTTHSEEASTWFRERYVSIEIVDVQMDGAPVPYEVDESGREIEVQIGDPDQTITGTHTYEITYKVAGALIYHENGVTELYWNVTGHGWEVPITSVTLNVTGPEGIFGLNNACYVGSAGATEPCSISQSEDTITFTSTDLSAGEGLTIAHELNGVDQLILERLVLWWPWVIGGVLWLIGLSIFAYRHSTMHRRSQTIVAQYEPYEDFKPMYTGLLFDGRLDARDITAGIVYLAEQGFWKIKRTERKVLHFFNAEDYEITLLRSYAEVETYFQQELFTLLFESDAPIGTVVSLGELAKNTTKQKENFAVLTRLRKAVQKDLIESGFFEHSFNTLVRIGLGALVVLALLASISIALGASVVSVVVPVIFILVGTIITLSIVYRRRTVKGYEARHHLAGFKEFLSVTDKERFAFHNAPAKSPEQFMEYLPYAIAFGVEKEWAKVFEDITLPQPDWYESGGAQSFSAVHLAQSVGAFSTTFAHASGSSSASSGGGSAGGGAGGGGGGSW